ncbi:hypothetical protein J1N35_021145 [Gossypium stocksii]|uniref:Reverse transcriptase domain-containing protein n=1 Tax=Gossypium stocksii TaxID=47602 RepID=A0A9D4A254_9ROSI|nr:hypothetical protein J1N35_021145 [Gossypium stocksii]
MIESDNLILFCKASRAQADVVNSILDSFCYFSSQKVNKSKSQVFFSLNTPKDLAEAICNDVGFSCVDDMGIYLGMPLFHNRVTTSTFAFIVDKGD